MRTRPDAHQETVARRLALLRAELDRPPDPDVSPSAESDEWWTAHTAAPEQTAAHPAPQQEGDHEPAPLVAVAVPVPGRHAARRSMGSPPLPGSPPRSLSGSLSGAIPEVLRGRVRLGPAQLAVVALGLAAALAVTCWWLARGRPTTIAAPPLAPAAASPLVALSPAGAAASAGAAPIGASVAASGAASAGAMVTVDVEGKVRRPGIVVLAAGSRVTDALAAAGGVAHHRSVAGLNLAAVLVDGQQIMVGSPAGGSAAQDVGAGSTGAGGTSGTGAPAGGALVDLNTATAQQLDTLPGVGPVTAQSILEWRRNNGSFTSVQELLEVDGIGPKTLEQILPHATV